MRRSTARFAFGRCIGRGTAPLLVGGLVATVGTTWSGTPVPWVHLGAFAPTAAICIGAVEFWPAFARARPGADVVDRLTRRPLHGGLAVAGGALLALAVLLLALVPALAAVLPAPLAHRALQPLGAPLLAGDTTRVEFAVPDAPLREIQLRPVALMPSATPVETRLQAYGDGTPLAPAPFAVRETHQLVRLPADGRRISRLTVERTTGNLPLLFATGGAVAVELAARSPVLGAAAALLPWLLPAALALLLALLFGPFVRLPVALCLCAAALLLQTLGDLGPAAAGLSLAARGRWLPSEPVFRQCLSSLGTAVVVMILAMAIRAGARR